MSSPLKSPLSSPRLEVVATTEVDSSPSSPPSSTPTITFANLAHHFFLSLNLSLLDPSEIFHKYALRFSDPQLIEFVRAHYSESLSILAVDFFRSQSQKNGLNAIMQLDIEQIIKDSFPTTLTEYEMLHDIHQSILPHNSALIESFLPLFISENEKAPLEEATKTTVCAFMSQFLSCQTSKARLLFMYRYINRSHVEGENDLITKPATRLEMLQAEVPEQKIKLEIMKRFDATPLFTNKIKQLLDTTNDLNMRYAQNQDPNIALGLLEDIQNKNLEQKRIENGLEAYKADREQTIMNITIRMQQLEENIAILMSQGVSGVVAEEDSDEILIRDELLLVGDKPLSEEPSTSLDDSTRPFSPLPVCQRTLPYTGSSSRHDDHSAPSSSTPRPYVLDYDDSTRPFRPLSMCQESSPHPFSPSGLDFPPFYGSSSNSHGHHIDGYWDAQGNWIGDPSSLEAMLRGFQ